jgi:KDO2-lipid IV(A) lauroyltransferase
VTLNGALDSAVHFGQYAALRSLFGVFHSFSVDQNMRTAAAIGRAYSRIGRRHRARAIGHLERSFPSMPRHEIEAIAQRSVSSLFQMFMVESVAIPRLLTPTNWPAYVGTRGVQRPLQLLLQDRPLLMVTGHCGNWELLGFVLALLGFRMSALARPLDNPWLDRWIRSVREARGLEILTKWGATAQVQEIVQAGGRVGFIADQNAGDDGLFVPFFGRLASSYKSIGLLAMRYDTPIVAGCARRIGDAFRYELECSDIIMPEEWRDQPDPLFYITARFNRAIEQMIRRAPEQYLWVHRRWKSRPPHERAGKPMPQRLTEKLRQLPWMTDDELDRLSRPVEPIVAPR